MIDYLNERFALTGKLEFVKGRGGLAAARVESGTCTGEVYLHGAHVTAWRPAGHEEVLWLSGRSRFAAGHPIRGGIPLCWPWFGDDPTGAGRDMHGFARLSPFAVTRTAETEDGGCVVELTLERTPDIHQMWPLDVRLVLTVTFGANLDLQLRMVNHSPDRVSLSAALHTYLRVGDVAGVRVVGLEGCDYVDYVGGLAHKRQDTDLRISGETDRIYLRTANSCRVADASMGRDITVAKSGSHSTVVWNPGPRRAREMAEIDDEGFRHMLCIEAANVAEDIVTLSTGERHCLGTTLGVASRAGVE